MTELNNYKHKLPVQIRFVDIDKLGHVNNATFLSYFETARVDYFVQVFDFDMNWNKNGMILAKSIVDYKVPVFLEDKISVYTSITRIGNKSFDMSNVLVKELNNKETICTVAQGILVCMDYESQQSISMPELWRNKIRSFEKNLIE